MRKYEGPCSVEGCRNPPLAKALCRVHYERQRRKGTTDKDPAVAQVMCPECGERFAVYKDPLRCRPCYQKANRTARIEPGICGYCGTTFIPKRYRNTGRAVYCSRECKDKAYVADGRSAAASRRHAYKRDYRLTEEQVAELRAKGCGICGAMEGGRWGNLHIDHDHDTGEVRGALCSDCNLGLGKFHDDPALLRAAAGYLERSAA